MDLLTKKAFRDLFSNRSRILTVFIAMILGTTVFATVTFTREVINRELDAEFNAMVPASATIIVDQVDEPLVQMLEEYQGISGYEIGAAYEIQMIRPDGIKKTVKLFSAPDYTKREINIITSVEGSFAPNAGEVLLEGDALGVADAALGGQITLCMPDGTTKEYTVTGLVNDLSQHPPSIHDEVYVYVSPETLAEIGLEMNQIDFLLSNNPYDRAHILDSTQSLIHQLEESGYQVNKVLVSNTPGVSMHREEYRGALFILQVFSVVGFLFGCMIMSSSFITILAGQVKQIGILKSIGAKKKGVIRAYLCAAAVLNACNIIISLPLSYFFMRGLSSFFLSIGNMKLHNFSLPTAMLIIVCIMCVVIPLLLALIPIRKGLSITVKEALVSLGIRVSRAKKDIITASLENKVSRPVLFSIRNAMANRRRFATNVAMLTLGGLMFVGVMASIISINLALSKSINAQQNDYQIVAGRYIEDEVLANAVIGHENVADYEIWGMTSGQVTYGDGNTGNSFMFAAVPDNTAMYQPNLMEGRWLKPSETSGIVVSFEFLVQEPGFQLGSIISFQFAGIRQDFEIVGIVYEIGDSNIYMSKACYEQLVPEQARRSSIHIITQRTGGRRSERYARIYSDVSENGIAILHASTKSDKQEMLSAHFATTLTSYMVVAILAVIVAGFGLSTTMKVQVQERTREIGIIKSMGANRKQIFSIITAESIYTCLFSFVICLLLGFPVGALAIQIIGVHILEIPLAISPLIIFAALVVWLVATLIVGRNASKKAAKNAADLTTKDALAFE